MVESAPPSGFSDRQRLHQRGRRVRLRSHATSARTLRIQFAGKSISFQFESKTMENNLILVGRLKPCDGNSFIWNLIFTLL